ncbi:YHS domain-containing (seleno)protein [Phreatobacter stygius]|uniref:YHS domain-containing protein n=1 Tax=Phreatobacter stygius TaxID=1940610 RepID=A0A4D7AVQ4_9HYPH|nr:YHS domain-containing (seleno)protein [Phreatobacter stygius]QCI65784.1 YHS domain-containing protein [Phreatobacter stygius]
MHPLSSPSRRGLIGLAAGLGLLAGDHAAAAEIYTRPLSSLGAGGHDVVAYFSEGRPVGGSSAFEHRWKGATWRFASAANRDAFALAPERYAPAYGGHCAWAASQGYRAAGDPRQWRIVDGRLFLNYDANVHRTWQNNIAGFIRDADRHWPVLSAQ